MGIKAILKGLTPPLVADLYRHLRYPPIWQGVYSHISAVPAIDESARDAAWRALRRDTSTREALRALALREPGFLPLLAAVVCRQKGGTLRVVDFGGGLGESYLQLLDGLPDRCSIEYHIVELEWACRHGSRLFEDDPRVRFHSTLPQQWDEVDILFAGSSIQYIADYAGVLKTLCRYQAEYLLFVDVYEGDFPTYATAELNVGGVPCWFVNRRELTDLICENGYTLILEAPMGEPCDQSNFPAEFRLPDGRTRVLLFARSRPASR